MEENEQSGDEDKQRAHLMDLTASKEKLQGEMIDDIYVTS